MTRDEVKKLIMIITYTYPNFKPENMSLAVDAWYEHLKDDDYGTIAVALKQYNRTNNTGFAPSIGQLLNTVSQLKTPMTDGEAWALVRRAIGRCNSYDRTQDEKAFNELPDTIQKAIGSRRILSEWSVADSSVVQGYFLKLYHNAQEVEKRYELMSPDVKALITEQRKELLSQL